MSPVIRTGATCGLGCGRPVWKDGYCAPCWHRENMRAGGPIAILPKPPKLAAVAADDIPDYFPKDWT